MVRNRGIDFQKIRGYLEPLPPLCIRSLQSIGVA